MKKMNQQNIDLGKFGSTEELLKAYNNLHAAFTKKCQDYAVLKKQLEATQQEKTTQQNQDQAICTLPENSILDNLLPPQQDNDSKPEKDVIITQDIDNQTDEQNQTNIEIDRFFNEYPQAQNYAQDIGKALNTQAPTFTDLLAAYNSVLLKRVCQPQEFLKDQNFLQGFVYCNNNIRQYFIKDYLSKLSGVKIPETIKGTIGVISVLPPIRPKNLKDAQNMARKILLKKGEI